MPGWSHGCWGHRVTHEAVPVTMVAEPFLLTSVFTLENTVASRRISMRSATQAQSASRPEIVPVVSAPPRSVARG